MMIEVVRISLTVRILVDRHRPETEDVEFTALAKCARFVHYHQLTKKYVATYINLKKVQVPVPRRRKNY